MAGEATWNSSEIFITEKDCIQFFHASKKTREQRLIGLEYELILVDRMTLLSVPFFGLRSLSRILLTLLPLGYVPIYDAGMLVGLKRGGTLVTLEPGGQIEFSSSPRRLIADVLLELHTFLKELLDVCESLALTILPIGYRPYGTVSSVQTVPRTRYLEMMPLLERSSQSSAGQKMTASMQVSLDFVSERHAGQMLQLGLKCQPYIVALFANSPFFESGVSPFKSYRMHVWSMFDQARSGIPEFILDPTFADRAFECYTQWALHKPVLFISRNDTLIHLNGLTFHDFLTHGFQSYRAVPQDWVMHLGTLYPEARMKNVVELRSADTCSPPFVAALSAFWKGLAYDDEALESALDLLHVKDANVLKFLYLEASKCGLSGRSPGLGTFKEATRHLVGLAAEGLSRQLAPSAEVAHLDVLIDMVERGLSPSDIMLKSGLASSRISSDSYIDA
ncbi:hypothetical protein KRR23_11505 [Pseudomonas sp. CVAP|uniref:glutamate-cysteine ligase family protein n=1 Tax=Pseudomonas sp. CVAP\|nr:glutamate-cysteine ligase family protein [Pseudomonas sp. CVAP\